MTTELVVPTASTLAGQWQGFAEACGLDPARGISQVQLTEMRRAFFCGAASYQRLIFSLLDGDPAARCVTGIAKRLEHLHDELRRFALEVGTAEEGN